MATVRSLAIWVTKAGTSVARARRLVLDFGRNVAEHVKVFVALQERFFFQVIGNWWRRRWDSNPRGARTPGGFQDRCLKPLGHTSV